MDFLERPFEGDHMFYTVTFLKGVIAEGFEGVSRGFQILWFWNDRAFPNGDVIDPPFFQKNNHVLHNTRSGDDPPLGKRNSLGPENNVGFYENLGPGRQMVQAVRESNGFRDRLQRFLISHNRNSVFAHDLHTSSFCLPGMGWVREILV